MPSVWRSARPAKAPSSAARGPSRSGAQARATAARSPSSRATRSKTVPASSGASRPGRREGRRPALPQPPGDDRPQVARLAGEELAGALDQPRPAQVARPGAGGPRRRQPGVGRRDDPLGQQRLGRQHQQLERALDVGRPPREHPGREHVQLRLAGPADEVAPPGRRDQARGRRAAAARRRRAGPPCRAGRPTARPGARRTAARCRARAASSARRTCSASGASRSSWRAMKVSDAVSSQLTAWRPPAPAPRRARCGSRGRR